MCQPKHHSGVQLKTCKRCKSGKFESDFGGHSRYPDGLNPWCRECCAAYSKQYRLDNIEDAKGREAKWREENREIARARTAAWMAAHPERQRSSEINYRAANPDKRRKSCAAY